MIQIKAAWEAIKGITWLAPWAIAGVLLVALLLTRATLADTKTDLASSASNLSVSNNSIGRLEGELEQCNSRWTDLAESDANRMKASEQALQLAAAAAKVRQAAIERLQDSAAKIMSTQAPGAAQCEASDTLKELWPA